MPFDSNHILFFFVPQEVKTGEIYNPTDLRTFRSAPDTDLAKLLKVQGNEVVLVKSLGGGEYEIIRRVPWPASQNAFDALLSTGNGSGDGDSNSIFSLNASDDPFSPGVPFGNKDASKTFLILLLIAAGIYVISK